MLNAKALANAVTIVTAGLFVVCWLLAALLPNFLFQMGQSWFHMMRLDPTELDGAMTFGRFGLGLIGMAVVTWVVTYLTVTLYNKWSEN